MNARILKSFTAIAVAATLMMTLSSCAGTPSTIDNPTSTDKDGYSEEYVKMANGEVNKCLWYDKGFKDATMSCDFSIDYSKR